MLSGQCRVRFLSVEKKKGKFRFLASSPYAFRSMPCEVFIGGKKKKKGKFR
jgi:hypothetical protein